MRSTLARTVLFAALVASVLELGAPPLAHAQAEDPERAAIARSLFHEGVELARAERYAEAADRFRRAYALRPAPAIGFNLASALSRAGSLVEATEVLRGVLRAPDLEPELRQGSQAMLDDVERRVGRLRVRLAGPRDEVSVQLDDRVLPDELLDVAFPIDPGPHVLTARRGDEEVARERVTVEEGSAAEVALELPEPRRALPPVALAAPAPEAASQVDRAASDDTALWVGLGVGAAVLVGVGVTLAIVLTQPAAAPDPIAGNTMPGVIEW